MMERIKDDPFPPMTAEGVTVRVPALSARMVIVVLTELDPNVPVIVTCVSVVAGLVVTWNWALDLPEGINTELGICTAPGLLVLSCTLIPGGGILPVAVTVAVVVNGPKSELSATFREVRVT